MKHKFSVIYELDTTVAVAVATYLDAEHYVFLHNKYSPKYEVLSHEGRKVVVKQTWAYGGRRVGQIYTCEYIPPARFINYGIKPFPFYWPSVHHILTTKTDLRYYPTEDGERTVSHLDVEIDMPIWLWPIRHVIEQKLTALKKEKDQEDMEMVERRAKLFGRGNIRGYLADHQFMLHKEDFVEHFG
jgi:hypothetical protein